MSSGGHAVFSPSASSRWLRCPGSAILSAGMPLREERDGSAAMRGTRAHLLAERVLKRQPLPEFGAAEARLAQPFIDHVGELARSRKGPVFIFPEEKLSILPDCWGTADAVVWAPEEGILDISDLKTGRWAVTPDATQLRLYAAGALASFPTARSINGWVVQPQVYDGPRSAAYEPWELSGLLMFAKERIDKAKANANDALRVGEWCRFCPARPICPAIAAEIVNLIPAGELSDECSYLADFD